MRKNTFIPVFTFAFTALAGWYTVNSDRERISSALTEAGIDFQKYDSLSGPTIYEYLLLTAAIVAILYGIYKVILFLRTGKEIDESAVLEEKIQIHDRNFSKKTNTWIYLILLALFVSFMAYLVIEMNVLG